MKIGIVNTNLGNLGSVKSAFEFYDYDVSLISNPDKLDNVDLIVLSGIGNFGAAVNKLKSLDFWDKIDDIVQNKESSILGICLGMQLFADKSYENGFDKGFGWIPGSITKLEGKNIKIPHIGWNKVTPRDDLLFKGIRYGYFYFMHSFCLKTTNQPLIHAITEYGDNKIISVVRKDNITGVQFHPEKSQGDGLRFIKNLVEDIQCCKKE